jgi:predicted small metal-binding protein
MTKVYGCDCGYIARGNNDDELFADVERHVRETHPELVGKFTRSDILAGATQE